MARPEITDALIVNVMKLTGIFDRNENFKTRTLLKPFRTASANVYSVDNAVLLNRFYAFKLTLILDIAINASRFTACLNMAHLP